MGIVTFTDKYHLYEPITNCDRAFLILVEFLLHQGGTSIEKKGALLIFIIIISVENLFILTHHVLCLLCI